MKTDILTMIEVLLNLIKDYNISGVQAQVGNLICLKADLKNSINLTNRDKLTLYRALFPPHGGLSDIHYWDNNFELRKSINEQISTATTVIANFLLYK